MVVGGAPRGERLAIRPGFAARPTEEIASARESRMGDDGRFGRAHGHDGDPPPAPPLPPGTANHAD
jgi:hypothetical protein